MQAVRNRRTKTWLKISNSTELNQFQTDDIVFIHADGNYSDIALVNGTRYIIGDTAQVRKVRPSVKAPWLVFKR